MNQQETLQNCGVGAVESFVTANLVVADIIACILFSTSCQVCSIGGADCNNSTFVLTTWYFQFLTKSHGNLPISWDCSLSVKEPQACQEITRIILPFPLILLFTSQNIQANRGVEFVRGNPEIKTIHSSEAEVDRLETARHLPSGRIP